MVFPIRGGWKMVKRMISGILVLIIAIGTSGCTKIAGVDKINPVKAVKAKEVSKYLYTSTVEAKSFYIMSEISGKITDISINQGDIVKEGQNILKLDTASLDIQKRQAQAALNIAKAAQAALTEEPKQSVQNQSSASVAQAQAAVDLAQLQIEKCTIKSTVTGVVTEVYATKGQVVSPSSPASSNIIKVTVSDYDSYIRSYTISTEVTGRIMELNLRPGDPILQGQVIAQIDPQSYVLQKDQALASLSLAKAQQAGITENPKMSQRSQAQASVDQAQAVLDSIQLQIDKCSIISQGDGVVEDVYLNKGEIVPAGVNIAKIMDLKNRYIKIYVEESKRNNVKLGQMISLYANNKSIGNGTVIYVAPESEFTPKNTETKSEKEKTVFQIKIKLDSNVEAAPGAMVDAEIK